MKPNALALGIALVAGFAQTPAAVQACKYSIRDIGFVHRANASYQLVLIEDDDPAAVDRAERAQLMHKALADANVTFSVLKPNQDAGHPILKRAAVVSAPRPGLWVVSPDGRVAPVAVPTPSGTSSWGIREIDALLDSPGRCEIGRHLTSGLGAVVVIEGADPASNQRAQRLAENVVTQVNEVVGKLEKPTKNGPAVVVVKADDSERWLRWGLGETLDEVAQAARITVVFGQFRRSGKAMTDPDFDPTKLFSHVAVLGYSCECSLDRAALFGPALPHRWGTSQRKRVSLDVGIDPESPQVRAEVNAILAKAPLIEAGEFHVTYEQLMLGFKETPLDEDDGPPPAKTVADAVGVRSETPTKSAQLPATISSGSTTTLVILFVVTFFVTLLGRFFWRRKTALKP